MSKRRIVFRADGNYQIGLGHVTRSLALADMLKESFSCMFAIQQPSESIREQILEVCEALIELPQSSEYLTEAHELVANQLQPRDIVVLDGYHFDTACQRVFKQAGHKLVCIDDIHAYHFVADAVINHGLGIVAEDYSAEAYTSFYFGLNFALLRKPFLEEQCSTSQNLKENRKIIVCFGGADPYNLTARVLNILKKRADVKEINIVIGSAFLNLENIISVTNNSNGKSIHLYQSISATALAKEICNNDFVICPASTVALESIFLGKPVITGYYVENQKKFAERILLNDYGINLGDFLTLDFEGINSALDNSYSRDFKSYRKNIKHEYSLISLFKRL